MKKILYAALAALFTLGLVSCQGNGNEQEKKNTIVLTVDSVGQDLVIFSISPSDTLAPYYIDAKPRSMVVGKTTEELIQDFKAGMDVVIALAANQGLQYSYADFCWQGEHQLYMDELTPATDYVLYVYYLDTLTAQAIGELHAVPFKTAELEILGEREVHMTNVKFQWSETRSNWSLSTSDADRKYSLLIYSQHNGRNTGTFTIENDDFWRASLFITGDTFYEFVELTITIEEAEDDLYLITLDGVASDGYRYHITMEPTPMIDGDAQEAPARMAPRRAAVTCAK